MLHGNQIGRFELRRYLDRGGFGEVWIADDPARRETVALKLIRLESLDPEMAEAERRGSRLQQELARQIPAVAAIHEIGESSGFLYISMEYVEGRDLSEILKGGPLPVDRAVHLALQLCRILEASHEIPTEDGRRGVIHSDIKPANIRLQAEDRVRLLDWGVAKSLSWSRKQTRHVFGSVAYLSPERLARGEVDRHADLWAVGVVLYQMITGSLPFSGSTDEEVEWKIRNRQPPERLPDNCPPALRAIIVRCLAFEVERRYPSATALRADLEAFQEGQPLAPASPPDAGGGGATHRTAEEAPGRPPAGAPSRRGGGAQESSTGSPRRKGTAPAPQRRRFRPRRLVAAVAVLVLVLSQVLLLVVGREIHRDLTLATSPDLLDLTARYQGIGWLDPLDLAEVRRDLKAALLEEAEGVMTAYKVNAATTPEDWAEALRRLQAASDLDGGDDGVLARLRYCQGHLDRLEADRRPADAQRLLQRGVDRFKEAARLAPELPDAHLGLLQIYADERFSPFDLQKLQGAYDRAEDLHHEPGDRERKALAKGHIRAGMALYARAETEPSAPESAQLLVEARKQFNETLAKCGELTTSHDAEVCEEAAARVRMVSALLREAGFL